MDPSFKLILHCFIVHAYSATAAAILMLNVKHLRRETKQTVGPLNHRLVSLRKKDTYFCHFATLCAIIHPCTLPTFFDNQDPCRLVPCMLAG